MYIYSIEDPVLPEFIFRYSHLVSCDPVVVQDNRAYVSLRSGSVCNRGVNALEIIDISDPYNPVLISNYPMEHPHGLAVTQNYLFLCEGSYGFKVFNIADEKNIIEVKQLTSIHAFDVIEQDGTLIITGQDGVFQYDFDFQSGHLGLLSKIPVTRDPS